MLTLKKRHRRRDRSLQSLAPGWTPPTPPAPPAAVHVSSVKTTAEPSVALWVFDQNVQNPTAAVNGFVAGSGGGHGGLAWERNSANSLKIEHNFAVSPGDPWSNTARAGGIHSTESGELEAGTGTVIAG
jgi:hypothetical protein